MLTVKMDNSAASAPQVGLSSADLVTEELVEGGITRLAVSYYSEIPDNVGPVRSMRATDIGIVQPLKATLVTSGGAAVTADRIGEAGIRVINEKGTGFYREESRSAPYNLFNKLTEVSDKLKPVDPPEPYLPFSDDGSLPAGKPAKGLSAVFSQGHTTSFTFGDGVWTNTNSFAAEGDRFEPETVLVLRVQVGDAGYTDPAGYPVPETKFTGTGAAQIFHDGKVVDRALGQGRSRRHHRARGRRRGGHAARGPGVDGARAGRRRVGPDPALSRTATLGRPSGRRQSSSSERIPASTSTTAPSASSEACWGSGASATEEAVADIAPKNSRVNAASCDSGRS